MNREWTEWNREQINSRPTARRKMMEFEAALAQEAFEKAERWHLIGWCVAVIFLCAVAGCFLGMLMAWLHV